MDIMIRAAKKEDMERLAEIYDHPQVVPESSQHPFLGIEKISALFEAYQNSTIVLVGEIAGVVEGYLKINLSTKPRARHVASLGMAVHPSAHGKGVGTALIRAAVDQADNWLNLVRLELEVYADNANAIKLYKKAGFEIEGESRFAAFKQGEYISLLRMAKISAKFNT